MISQTIVLCIQFYTYTLIRCQSKFVLVFLAISFRDVFRFGNRGRWLDGTATSRNRRRYHVHDGNHGPDVVGRIHIPDRRPRGRAPGWRVIANLRTQEVSSFACDSYDGWMAVNHVLRE
jgi:hypothetical protein